MRKIYWWLLTLIWMTCIWWLSNQPDLQSGLEQDYLLRKIAHILEFGILAFLLMQSLRRTSLHIGVLVTAAVQAFSYAILDEYHQTWVVGRHGAATDVAIDTIGILIVCGAAWWFARRSAAK